MRTYLFKLVVLTMSTCKTCKSIKIDSKLIVSIDDWVMTGEFDGLGNDCYYFVTLENNKVIAFEAFEKSIDEFKPDMKALGQKVKTKLKPYFHNVNEMEQSHDFAYDDEKKCIYFTMSLKLHSSKFPDDDDTEDE